MMTKILYLVLALIIASWMIFDGVHVLVKGKYFGPPEPGPWSRLVAAVGLDPFSLGPVFIVLGLLWIVSAISLLLGTGWSWGLALVVAVCTLWYVPLGTVLAVAAILLLGYAKSAVS